MLIDSFLKYKGWSGNGKDGNFPLLPYIFADALYLAHDAYIKGKLTKKAKFHANRMMDCYWHLNKDFFRAFNEQETEMVVNKMDEFDDYIHNDMEFFRMSVMKPLMSYPSEIRELCAGVCVCKLLACHMEYVYGVIYRDPYGRAIKDQYISGIKHHACEMFNQFRVDKPKDYVDLNDIPMVQQSVLNISKRIKEFADSWNE